MTDRSGLTDRQLTEEWQRFQSGHLERQTSAIESIRTLLIVWTLLGVIGLVLVLALSFR